MYSTDEIPPPKAGIVNTSIGASTALLPSGSSKQQEPYLSRASQNQVEVFAQISDSCNKLANIDYALRGLPYRFWEVWGTIFMKNL